MNAEPWLSYQRQGGFGTREFQKPSFQFYSAPANPGGGSASLSRVGPLKDGGYLICKEAAVNATLAISIGIRGSDPFGAAWHFSVVN